MMPVFLTRNFFLTSAVLLTLTAQAPAQVAASADFQRGYYLQMHERDPAGAAAAFEAVANRTDAPAALRAESRLRLAQCREDVAAADFARLMPADVIAYAEISNPGDHLASLIEQLGLLKARPAPAGAAKPEATPLDHGFFLPHDLALSPALLETLKSFRGAAVAITRIDPQKGPEGVVVLHPGETDLLRGVLESGIQFFEPAEPLEGFRTYSLMGQGWAAVTTRLIVAARSREQLAETVGRLCRPGEDHGLAGSERFQAVRKDHAGAMLFAYVDGPRAATEIRRHLRGFEAQAAAAFFDLEHLKSASISARATESGVEFQARLDLAEGHRNLAYGLIRTAPCSRKSLEWVPAGAAGVALLGLNPAGPRSPVADAGAVEGLSAMDIGREVFANLEEAAVFVAPLSGQGPQPDTYPVPDVGVVFIAKDPAKSQALWSQLLSLPALFVPQMKASVQDTTLEGTPGSEYRFPDAPPLVLARVKDRAVVFGTRGAVAAAIRAGADQKSIIHNPDFRPLLARLAPSTSKAVMVHVGRAFETAAGLERGRHAEQIGLAALILANLRVCVVTEEKPAQFALRAEAAGLPNVPEAVRKLAALIPRPHDPPAELSRRGPQPAAPARSEPTVVVPQ